MNNTEETQDQDAHDPVDAEAEVPEGAEDGADEAEDSQESELQTQLDEAQAQAQNHWDSLLRMRAEMDNLRKRSAREVEKARKFGIERFATDLLLVSDSLEQGLSVATDDTAADQLREGMSLTLKMFDKVLTDHGIKVVDPEGQPFDPEVHEAMSMIPATDGQSPNTVVTVVQKGYLLNERLIRPARVIVTKD